ncbi:MAG: hypothetical protein ABFE07_28665 [Armatimonadia bacterium]
MSERNFRFEPDLNAIPEGPYCYGPNGEHCPYWSKIPDRPYQENGHCALLGKGDWELEGGLLWDSCKECGLKDQCREEDRR